MKLIGRTLLILFAFLSHYYISGSLNVKNILTQISKGDLTKEDVIKFYNKDFDPMLEFHKIFTPCLNHLIDQEMKTESFITNIIQSIKEFFSSSYQEYSIPELGMKIKCETYINKLVSPDFIEKKKVEVLDLKRKLLANAQASMKFRSKEESTVEAKNSKKDKLPLPGSNPHQKYSPNNKMKNNEINVENNGELKGVKLLKENDVQIPDLNGAEKIEYQVNPEKLFKDVLKNNKNKNKDITNSSICEKDLKKQKEINDLLGKEKDLLQKSLHSKSLELTQVSDENCKCNEAKHNLESEITQCRNEKTELQIRNTKEKSNEEINKIRQNNPTSDETKSELITKIEEIRKLKEENIKCKQDLDDEKKKVSENKDALQAQKVLSEKLLKENSDKLFEEKDKLAKELKVCNEKLDKKDDSKDKTIENCTKDLQAKEQDVKNLNDKLKTCVEKITTKSDNNNNNNNKINDNGKSEFIISNNDVEDIKHEQVTPSSNTELAKITEKLKNCEDRDKQKFLRIDFLNKEINKAKDEIRLLSPKLVKETAANLASGRKIEQLEKDIKSKNMLQNDLKKACDKKGKNYEAQINQLINESKELNKKVKECLQRETYSKADKKDCSEKLIVKDKKVKELEKDKKTLGDKCNKDIQILIEENTKLKNDLIKEGSRYNKILDDFSAEKNKLEKCEGINNQIFTDAEKKCELRLNKIKEENDVIVKDVRNLYQNLNNTCTKEKEVLKDKVNKIAKDLSTCEVNSLNKYNKEHKENEKCQVDLIQERADRVLNHIKKSECDNKVKTREQEKTKLEEVINTLKKEKVCPVCPPCQEIAYKEKIETLTAKLNEMENIKKQLDDQKNKLTSQNTLLNNSLMETEKKCKEESEKAAKDLEINLQKEKEECKRLTTQCDSDKNTLTISKKKLNAELESCMKDIEHEKKNCIRKELLDKCKKEKKERGESIGKLHEDLNKCNREYKELINSKTKIEMNEKNCLKKHEALESQLKIKGDEAEKYRKAQAERESECSDLVFELKSKLLTQLNDLESIRYSEEAKKSIIESHIQNLSIEDASDRKEMDNYAHQMGEEIQKKNSFNDVLKNSNKAIDEMEKQKAEIVAKIVKNKPKLDANNLKKLSHEIEIRDDNIKTNKDIIKSQEFNIEISKNKIDDLNSNISVIDSKIKYNVVEKKFFELLLEPYNDVVAKVKALVDDNHTLMTKYNKTAQIVIKEAVKAGTANEKFEKIFADHSQKLAGLEAIIASSSAKFKEDLKIISDRMNKEKEKCLTELNAANSAKDAKCLNELNPILKTFEDFNKKIINNNVSVDNINNNKDNKILNKDGLATDPQKSFNNSEINKNSPDLNSCLNLISDKMYTENNCALLEPLRAKYNDLCRVNQLAPPNKDILSFATQPPKDGNKTMLKRLSTKKI